MPVICIKSGCRANAEPLSNLCIEHRFDGKDINANALNERVDKLERALRNVQLLACRELARKQITPERTREMWNHALRFCREVGIDPSVLRGSD